MEIEEVISIPVPTLCNAATTKLLRPTKNKLLSNIDAYTVNIFIMLRIAELGNALCQVV